MNKKIKTKCSNCNKKLSVYPCFIKKNKYHFCDRKCCDNWRSKNIKGINHYNYKEKIKVKCDNCFNEITIYPYKIKRDKHHFCDTKCMGKWQSKNRIGDKHPNYKTRVVIKCTECKKYLFMTKRSIKTSKYHFCCKGCKHNFQKSKKGWSYIHGQGNAPYPLIFSEKFKDFIIKRDGCRCQYPGCNMTQKKHLKLYKQKLHVHHVNYDTSHVNSLRTITLCRSCNGKVNTNKDYWFAYFCYILSEFYKKKGRNS